jgi:hypothetical protein
MADEFGRAVMRIEVDDTKLRTGLRQDEAIVNQAVDAMQGDLNRLTVSVGDTGEASRVASTGIMALGQAATASGSIALTTTAQWGMLALSAKELGNQALGATAQMKAWGAAAARFVVSPAGLAIAAIAAVGTALAVTFSETARNKIAGIGLGIKDLEERNAALTQRLMDQRQAIKGRMQALEDQIILETTGVNRALERMTLGERELRLELQRVQAAKALKTASAAQAQTVVDRVIGMKQEIAILEGVKTASDFITNALERQVYLEREKAKSMREAADAKEREADAWKAQLGAQGPQTREEARMAIKEALQLVEASQRGMFYMRTEFERWANRMGMTASDRELLERQLGPAFFPTREAPAAAARPIGGGVAAGAFPGGRAASGAGFFDSQRKEAKRTKDVGDIAKAVSIIAGAVQQGALGADRVGPP